MVSAFDFYTTCLCPTYDSCHSLRAAGAPHLPNPLMSVLRRFSEKVNGIVVVLFFSVTYLIIVPFFKFVDVVRELSDARKEKPRQSPWYKKNTKAYDRDFFDSMG